MVITSTEADQGNLVPMELMKRVLEAKGLPGAVMFHDVRWGAMHDGRWLWVLLNSGSCGAYAFNEDLESLEGVHSYRQPSGYFPVPGGTFAGVSRPGPITWSRAWIDRNGGLVLDLGRGESVDLPEAVRESLVARDDPPVAVHGGRPRLLARHDHGPLHEQPRRRGVWRHLRRDGGPWRVVGVESPSYVGDTRLIHGATSKKG